MKPVDLRKFLIIIKKSTPKRRWMFNSGWNIAITGISRCRQNNTFKTRQKRTRIVFQRSFLKTHISDTWLNSHYCKTAKRFNEPFLVLFGLR